MEKNNSNSLKEAHELVVEYEKHAKYSGVLAWVFILMGILLIAIYAYGHVIANDFQHRNQEIFENLKGNEVAVLVSEIVDKKIDLLRVEIKMRNNVSGLVGGLILGVGIAGVIGRKTKHRKLRAIKEIIQCIEQ